MTRISSTNSIRRPLIKPRQNTSLKARNTPESTHTTDDPATLMNSNQLKIFSNKDETNTPIQTPKTIKDEKPPVYPSPTSVINTGGYSLISQKRRDFLQKSKLNGNVNSPKATAIKIETPPPSPSLIHITNFEPNENNAQQKIIINRGQLSSPLQNYPQMNNNNHNNTPAATNFNNNNSNLHLNLTNNNKTTANITPTPTNSAPNSATNNNYANLRYNESNYREFQAARLNNQMSSTAPAQPTATITNNSNTNNVINYSNMTSNVNSNLNKFKPNNTEPKVFTYVQTISDTNQANNANINSNAVATPQFNISKIPLSPSSNLKTNTYFNPIEKPPLAIGEHILKRPSSANTINSNGTSAFTPVDVTTTEITAYTNGANLQRAQNLRFGNSNLNANNQTSNLNQLPPPSPSTPQRVLSADNVNRNFKNFGYGKLFLKFFSLNISNFY